MWEFLNRFRNSRKYSAEINYELNKEFMERTQSASVGFFMSAGWVVIRRLESVQFTGLILGLGSLLLFTSAARLWLYWRYKNNPNYFSEALRFSKFNVIVNGLLWSLVTLIPIWEFHFSNQTSSLTTFGLTVGFTMASIITLSFSLVHVYFFQWILILPTLASLYYFAFRESNEPAMNAAVVLSLIAIYLFRQTLAVHRQTVNGITNQIELRASNISLEKSRKELLDEKAKLQHSVRLAAIGEIAAEVGHEINNPLGLINGYVEMSIEEIKNGPFERESIVMKLEKARGSVERITKIIKGLKIYSRSTRDEAFVEVLCSEILDDVLEFCSEKLSYYNIALESSPHPDCKIWCRPIEISQVILNLMINAIDEVTKLEVEQRKIFLDMQITESKIKIAISNAGPKIAAELKERIFEPFFSTKKIGVGTGLGLSISRNIAEAHGGRVFYDESKAINTFVMELPLA